MLGDLVELTTIEMRNSVNRVKPTFKENDMVSEVSEKDTDIVLATLNSVPVGTIEIPDNFDDISSNINPRNSEVMAITDIKVEKDIDDDKSFFRRFVSGLAGKVINTENVQKKSFIEYTVDGFNFLADQDVIVDKEVDENGKVVAYNLNGNNISLSRSNKEKPTE